VEPHLRMRLTGQQRRCACCCPASNAQRSASLIMAQDGKCAAMSTTLLLLRDKRHGLFDGEGGGPMTCQELTCSDRLSLHLCEMRPCAQEPLRFHF
jgi:hypothetical protein